MLTRPWPGMFRTLYKEPERYVETYWSRYGPDVYVVGDAARRDEDGYFWVVGRTDDVINVSGHRLSTMEVESACVSHPNVAEAAVVPEPDEATGQAIVAFVTMEGGGDPPEGFDAELREHVATQDRQARAPEALHLGRRPAQDALRQDHAAAAEGHRRGTRAGRRHDAARPDGDGHAPGEGRSPERRRRLRAGAFAPAPISDQPLSGSVYGDQRPEIANTLLFGLGAPVSPPSVTAT